MLLDKFGPCALSNIVYDRNNVNLKSFLLSPVNKVIGAISDCLFIMS